MGLASCGAGEGVGAAAAEGEGDDGGEFHCILGVCLCCDYYCVYELWSLLKCGQMMSASSCRDAAVC